MAASFRNNLAFLSFHSSYATSAKRVSTLFVFFSLCHLYLHRSHQSAIEAPHLSGVGPQHRQSGPPYMSGEGADGDDVVDGLRILVAEVAFVVRMKPVAFLLSCGPVPLPDGEP